MSLKEKRRRAKINQVELAEALGVHVATLVDIERGRVEITRDCERRIANTIINLAKKRV